MAHVCPRCGHDTRTSVSRIIERAVAGIIATVIAGIILAIIF